MKAKLSLLLDLLAGLLTLLLLGALFAPPAQASLQIVGETRHAAVWFQIYDRLPSAWKADHPLLVQEVPYAVLNPDEEDEEANSPLSPTEEEETFVNGIYEEGDRSTETPPLIQLLDSLNDEESGLDFAHEYGHFLWCERLTQAQRVAYEQLWLQQKQAGSLVTAYAGVSSGEGFAESIAYFLQYPAELREKDAKSWQFLLALQTSGQKQSRN